MVRCRTCDRDVAGSNSARGCCVPTPTQRAIPPGSVNEYQRIRGLAASAGVRLRAKETEINAAPCALEARERTLLSPTLLSYLLTYLYSWITAVCVPGTYWRPPVR